MFQSLLSTFNCFVDTSFVISNNSKYKPFWEMFLFPHCLCKTNFWCILRPPQKEGKKRKSKKKKSACLIHFKVNYWIHVWLSSPRLKLIVIIFNCISFLFNVSYVFVVSPVCQYSLLSWCETSVWTCTVWPSRDIFLNPSKKMSALVKAAPPPLKPSALIVRKLRVLVNNDQIYFFVFSLMTADIEQTTEVKLWIVIRY